MSESTHAKDARIDEEIVLKFGSLELFVSLWGASLRGLIQGEGAAATEIITRYKGTAKVGGQGDVLIPFPGRVAEGRYEFDGTQYQMRKNDSEAPNAIHGFLRMRPWEVIRQQPASVTFGVHLSKTDAEGYPFSLRTELTYSLHEQGMTANVQITNTGDKAAPVAAGFHPYFTVNTDTIDTALLELPFRSYLEYNSQLVPTGKVFDTTGTPFEFITERLIGSTVFNTCFLNPVHDQDNKTRVKFSNPDGSQRLTIWLGPEINYVVLYSGDPLPESHRRRSLAIEPMTCGSDAFNHPAWGLLSVAPGQTVSASWGVTVDE